MKYYIIKNYFLSIICFSIGYGIWCYFEMILWGDFWDVFRLRFGVIVMSAIWGLFQGVVLGVILIFIEKNWLTTLFRDVPIYGIVGVIGFIVGSVIFLGVSNNVDKSIMGGIIGTIGGVFLGIVFAYFWNNRISTNKSNHKS